MPCTDLPEESLDVLNGEDALGEWQLEILDNRTGAPALADALRSWELRFVFENPYTIGSNSIGCLPVPVPPNALFATNILVSATGPLNVWFNQAGCPIGSTNANDVLLLPGATNGTVVLSASSTPPLVPGTNYYLGFQNTNSTNVNFVFRVDFGYTANAPAAFPGAEGAGANAVGGRGGDVYHVVNLNDSGPGSLRDAVSAPHRTVVFDVSGTINVLSPIKITNSFLTIAGQTAPGDGITVKGWLTSVEGGAHDVVVRFLRFRPGDINCPTFQDDSFHFDNAVNSIADHVSASWSIDETLSVTHAANITVQWSTIAESLNCSCHLKGCHGYGSLLRYSAGALSFHHNLYADNYSRNPRPGDSIRLDFVNNVVFNWGIFAGYNEDDTADNPTGFMNSLNYAGNYFIAGPSTSDNFDIAFRSGVHSAAETQIYQSGNLMDSNTNGILDGTNTGWGMFSGLYTPLTSRVSLPQVATDDATVAYERVLDFAGVSADKRDTVDTNIVAGVRNQNGAIINSQNDVSGWPTLNSTLPPPDTDQDGMPDYWEITLGLKPTDPADGNQITASGYTQLEEYLNWLAAPHALAVTNTPVSVDLYVVAGKTGNLTFSVANGTNRHREFGP